jgi:hypothetical protein
MAKSLSMLARWVFIVWGAWLGALGLAAALTAWQVWHPNPVLPVGLPTLTVAAWLCLLVAATVRLIRGPRRDLALASLLMGTAPLWFSVGHALMAIQPAFDRHVPPGWPSKVLFPLARSFADLEARWFYPERTPGKWVTMVGARAKDARAQVAAMDRHVEVSLARLDQSATWPIIWYRGPLFGVQGRAAYNIAFGSEVAQSPPEADGLTNMDRHEVAHCLITRNYTARSDPPRVLIEGWAQANQGTPAEELAVTAWDDHQKGLSLSLRQLVAPDWYWYSGPAAYSQGAPLVNYLLRVYGPERFLKLYTTCQQATFEANCRATLGIGLDELEAACWADTEQIARRAEPPARVWLKSRKLDPSIDPAVWEAFLTDYFAAAERLLAPFDHDRLKTRFRFERQTKAANGAPNEWDEELTLLRSGPFARARVRVGSAEAAILAHPDHSLRAYRKLSPKLEPWMIPDDSALQSYRIALNRVLVASGNHTFIATHGGAALLEYDPQNFMNYGIRIPDLEVARLTTSTDLGHPRITLTLRSTPAVREADREAFTYVFAVDDSFVVRSEHYESPNHKTVSDCRFEYDRSSDGRLVLRSLATTMAGQSRPFIRLEVEECRFGPIPEAEFALEPFLAELQPGGIVRKPVAEPATATLLGWYWLAFLAGGISLAGGSGLALSSRNRDRQAC